MPRQRALKIAIYAALVVTAGASLLMLPRGLSVKSATAGDPPDSIRLRGTVRDFRRSHPDFDVFPDAGYGHYAGNVAQRIGSDMRPVFNTPSDVVTDFDIVNQNIVPDVDFAMEVTLVGSAIFTGSYHRPVTARIAVGSQTFEPFGAFESPVYGNVNDIQSATGNNNPGPNPRVAVVSELFDADSVISATGRSWRKIDSASSGLLDEHWETWRECSSLDNSPQLRVLRRGDAVPDMDGAFDQDSVAEYLEDYIDFDDETIAIEDHQAIFLYELGVSGNDDGADFQDLVIVVSLATDPSYFLHGDSDGEQSHAQSAGFRVGDQWRDRDGYPIAPHLFMNGEAPPIQLAVEPDLESHAVIDSFNPANGPYGGSNVGPPAPIVIGDGETTVFSVPTGLPYVDTVEYDDDSDDLESNMHCRRFKVDHGTTLWVDGHVTVVVDEEFRIDNGAEIELDDGATLTVYSGGNTYFDNQAQLNVESHDPDRVAIYVTGSGALYAHNHAQIYATIVAPDATLDLNNHADLAGSFTGRSLSLANHAGLHVVNYTPQTACGEVIADAPGTASTTSTGAITTRDTFDEWYRSVMGVNLAIPHAITLVRDEDGVYEYSEPEFRPIDGRLFGNEGDGHNYYFTFVIDSRFDYESCGGQFLEFRGADDAWLFIDGRLVMDLGGVIPDSEQHVDLDRLGLIDGERYRLMFFYAQRQDMQAGFHMRTNIAFEGNQIPMASGGFD